jgi:hypothetical protein
MKILRSVTRRGFEVGTAGWFTVTGPRRWFPASRLPGGFQDFIGQPKRTEARVIVPAPDQKILDGADSHETALPLQLISPSERDHHLIRLVLIVLAAAVLTLSLLAELAS